MNYNFYQPIFEVSTLETNNQSKEVSPFSNDFVNATANKKPINYQTNQLPTNFMEPQNQQNIKFPQQVYSLGNNPSTYNATNKEKIPVISPNMYQSQLFNFHTQQESEQLPPRQQSPQCVKFNSNYLIFPNLESKFKAVQYSLLPTSATQKSGSSQSSNIIVQQPQYHVMKQISQPAPQPVSFNPQYIDANSSKMHSGISNEGVPYSVIAPTYIRNPKMVHVEPKSMKYNFSQNSKNGLSVQIVNSVSKRKRRKASEINRMYTCTFSDCKKAYGTLNHLNTHVSIHQHGPKRLPYEFSELRKKLNLQKKPDTQRMIMESQMDKKSDNPLSDSLKSTSSSFSDASKSSSSSFSSTASFDSSDHLFDRNNTHSIFLSPIINHM